MRALSSTPDKPNTRSRGQPVCLNARYVSTSTGLLTSSSIALGACRITLSTTERDTARLASRNCSRLMPGLRGRPAVMITSSEPASSAGSAPPLTWVSKPNSGADSCMSSAMPRATPSSMPSNTSSRHSDSFARICAVDSPTRPGPTMAIFFKATSFRTAHRDDERRRMFCKVGSARNTSSLSFLGLRRHKREHNAVFTLAAMSLVYYGWWSWKYLLLLIPLMLANYAIAQAMAICRERRHAQAAKVMLMIGLAINLVALGYYKYANFFVDNINAQFGLDLFLSTIVLPLGISFFTFQKIALLVDVYYGKVGRLDLLDYSLFVAFFPQLIAGPIVHHSEMMPQFKQAAAGTHLDMLAAWSGALAYTAQLYFDFSGYSNMAIGLGLLFGVR